MRATKNLTEGNIYKNLLIYAVPLILSSLLMQAYSTVDGMIAGKFISEYALGAVSATSSFDTLISQLMNGFFTGFAVYIAHLFGSRSYAEIKRDVVGTGFVIVLASLLFSVLTIALRTPVMTYLKIDQIIYAEAERYFIVYTAGYVIFYFNSFVLHVLHALGITSFSLYVSVLSALLNIGGNLLTILVFDMGVAGLALSTVLSALVSTVIYIVILRRAFREMPSEAVSYRPSFYCLARSARYTVPAALQMLAFHGITFFIAPAINALGAAATTGYNVANRLYSFATLCLWQATAALSCYIGQCVGVGDPAKIRRGFRCGVILNVALLLPAVLVISLFAGGIVSVFFPNGYVGEAYQYAVRYARYFLPFVFVQLVGHVLHAYMRSLARMGAVLGVTLLGSATRLAATLLLVPTLQLDGVYIGQIISWGIDALVSLLLFFCLYHSIPQLERLIKETLQHRKKA